MRYACKVQYVGKNYAGSQLQLGQNIPTIQEELEKAISTLIESKQYNTDVCENEHSVVCEDNNRRVKTIFSGRTDRGVNSIGQVIHFDTDKQIVASKFMYQLNEILPDDISVSDLKKVDSKFHAQKSAKSRHYVYEFINRKNKNAFDGDLMRVKYDIDIERMQQSLNFLLGEHDFSSFKSSGTLNPSKVCHIYEAKVSKVGDKVQINIVGNRFLYNMVRAIVGTLLEIEGHNLSSEHMKDVLEAKDRTKAGQNVSPYGLTLIDVEY